MSHRAAAELRAHADSGSRPRTNARRAPGPARGSGRSPRRAASLALALLAACGGGDANTERATREVERLAFVAAGQSEVPSAAVPRVERPLLVDRFEVTRAQWRAWLEGDPPEARGYARARAEGPATWPAVWMDLDEARAFAASRGMRLPTASEWFFVAMGPRGQDWPWDQYAARAVSNTLEIGLGSPSPVGVFEQGRTAQGVYDLIGNVWEWVAESLPPEELAGTQHGWRVGGSYKSPRRELFLLAGGYHARDQHRDHRSDEVGVRCVADAEEYLVGWARAWRGDADARARLRRVGQGWGRAAVPLLRRLAEEHRGNEALEALLEGASA